MLNLDICRIIFNGMMIAKQQAPLLFGIGSSDYEMNTAIGRIIQWLFSDVSLFYG